MKTYTTLLQDQTGAVRTITTNRPEVLNAMNTQMGIDLLDAFDGFCANPKAQRCIVLTGAGTVFPVSGVVTEATLRLYPRLEHTATILVPFTTLNEVTAAVPRILDRGVVVPINTGEHLPAEGAVLLVQRLGAHGGGSEVVVLDAVAVDDRDQVVGLVVGGRHCGLPDLALLLLAVAALVSRR